MGILSNALPIQWWAVTNETYNETQPGFVRKEPYTHEWQADDIIKDQIADEIDPTKSYSLIIRDNQGDDVVTLPYIKTLLPYGPPLAFTSILNSVSWTVSPAFGWNYFASTRSSYLPFSVGTSPSWSFAARSSNLGSKFLATNREDYNGAIGWPPATYNLQVQGAGIAAFGMLTAPFLCKAWGSQDGGSTFTLLGTFPDIASDGFNHIVNLNITTTKFYSHFGFTWEVDLVTYPGAWTGSFQFDFTNGIRFTNTVTDANAEYDLEFSIDDLLVEWASGDTVLWASGDVVGISSIAASNGNTLLQFFINDGTADLYKSDFHLFKTEIPIDAYNGSKLIQYKQYTNYASIDYPNNGNYFTLRLPCKFFTEREVEVETSVNLTSKVIDTSTFIVYQRLLQVPVMPDYMLKKLGLILGHSVKGSLFIDGKEWTKQEAVSRTNPGGDIKYPKQMAQVWLTEKDSGVRNII